MPTRKFRFAVSARGRGDTLDGLKDFARKAEDFGYDVLMLPDHLYEQLSPLPALVAAAQHTSRIRFATLTVANDFRHPVMLAKEAATVDVLTGGRFELGIGTGSSDNDNRMAGLPIDPPGVRVERMVETLHIVKHFFTGEKFDFAGTHYQVKDLPGYPRPAQAHLPILMGASGPRMLRLAAREADIISVMGNMAEKRDVIREAAGPRYDQLELNTLAMRVQIDGKPDLPPPANPQMRGYVGAREEVVEQLLKQREATDVSYIAVVGGALEAFAPVVAKLAGV